MEKLQPKETTGKTAQPPHNGLSRKGKAQIWVPLKTLPQNSHREEGSGQSSAEKCCHKGRLHPITLHSRKTRVCGRLDNLANRKPASDNEAMLLTRMWSVFHEHTYMQTARSLPDSSREHWSPLVTTSHGVPCNPSQRGLLCTVAPQQIFQVHSLTQK